MTLALASIASAPGFDQLSLDRRFVDGDSLVLDAIIRDP